MSLRFRDRDGGGLRRWVGENDGGGEKKTLRLVARYADACNLFATDAAVVAHKLSVLDRHCEAEARDPATIERTIITAADPLADQDAFLSEMERYAAMGITAVWVNPHGPDPAGWTEQTAEEVLPRLRDI